MHIWVKSQNCGCLVTWFCYQLLAKPGNKTATVSWADPYIHGTWVVWNVLGHETMVCTVCLFIFLLQPITVCGTGVSVRTVWMLCILLLIKMLLTIQGNLYLWHMSLHFIAFQGLYSLRRLCLISIGIPIINLRWSSDHLRFIMGIPIPVRRRVLSE